MKRTTAFVLFLTLLYGRSNSQTTNSPYSLLGIGDIETDHYNRTSGMANTGLAYRNTSFLINNNPASYTALQPQYFSLEVSARGQFANYYGTPLNGLSASNKDFTIKQLAIGTKVAKWWGTGGGLAPFSTSNYLLEYPQNVSGTNSSVPATIDGSGGINQVYWVNSFQPFKYFSVGVKAAYLFGSLSETQTITQTSLSTSLQTTQQIYYKNFYFTYGAQYYMPVNKHWDVNLGGTFSPEHKLASNGTVTVLDNAVQISTAGMKNTVDFTLPKAMGGGFSITKDKKYTFAADYTTQAWGGSNTLNAANAVLRNSNRASVGFEISNNVKNIQQVFEKSFVQGGLYYGNSYLQVNGQQLKELGLTLGYGIFRGKPPLGTTLGVMVGIDVGQRGTTANNNIRENYVNFHVILSYRDFWHTRGTRFF